MIDDIAPKISPQNIATMMNSIAAEHTKVRRCWTLETRQPHGALVAEREHRALAGLPPRSPLLHFGEALPRWYEEHALAREADPVVEARFVDLQKRLRAAAVWPRPVFGLPDFVRHGLGDDPHRAGHAGCAGLWAGQPDGETRLREKLRSDLGDLEALFVRVVDAAPSQVDAGGATTGAVGG